MKIDEIISTLKVMRAEVERYYPMDCAAALDEAIKALISLTQMSGTWIPVMDENGQLPEVDEDGYSLPLLCIAVVLSVGYIMLDNWNDE